MKYCCDPRGVCGGNTVASPTKFGRSRSMLSSALGMRCLPSNSICNVFHARRDSHCDRNWRHAQCGASPGLSDNRTSEAGKLLEILPRRIVEALDTSESPLEDIIEIVLDYGRVPLARLQRDEKKQDVKLSVEPVSREELEFIVNQCSEFAEDNRSGIDGTLHRISAIKNRHGRIVGITCRVGEAVKGSAVMVKDIVMDGYSVLLLGRPGVGKTTVIREISRMLADEAFKRVVIIDTSNEIGGDGDIPHAGIGRARRMQVASPSMQHTVMIEAVENHMPNVIVIDEIGTQEESLAARSISQRGVQLIATAHGNVLENIIKNPSLNDVVGSISSVTLGDEESRRRGVQKSVLERSAPPTFDVVIEMIDRTLWNIHTNVADSVDSILRGKEPHSITRKLGSDGVVVEESSDSVYEAREQLVSSKNILSQQTRVFEQKQVQVPEQDESKRPPRPVTRQKEKRKDALHVFIEGIEEDIVAEVREELGKEDRIELVDDVESAQAVVTTRVGLKSNGWIKEVAKYSRMPLFLVRSATKASVLKGINKLLSNEMMPGRLLPHGAFMGEKCKVLRATGGILECKSAIEDIVMKKKTPIEIVPKDAETMLRVRTMANEYKLENEILGSDEQGTVRLRILPSDFERPLPRKKIHNRTAKVEFW